MLSLNTRVLIAASFVLTSFFGLAGFALENIYRTTEVENLKHQLLNHIVTLIAATEFNDDGEVFISDILSKTSSYTIAPQYYAQVASNDSAWVWRSLPVQEANLQLDDRLLRNNHQFETRLVKAGRDYAVYSLGVAWGDGVGQQTYTFSVAVGLKNFDERIANFRRSLWGWLGGVAIVLLFAQWRILKWGLHPLAKAAGEITAIKTGNQLQLEHEYPQELETLTDNINNLLQHQHQHLQRYRNSLDDLAHSLKTPVAILNNEVNSLLDNDQFDVSVLNEQLQRVSKITNYQLQRAAIVGDSPLTAPVPIRGIVENLFTGLKKIYADKNVQSTINTIYDHVFHGDEGDLYEILGNVSENAFKWCNKRVSCTIIGLNEELAEEHQLNLKNTHTLLSKSSNKTQRSAHTQGVMLFIEDDGNGIDDSILEQVVKRGTRGDELTEGQGIGLSVVKDIIELYDGSLYIGASALGGASICLMLP